MLIHDNFNSFESISKAPKCEISDNLHPTPMHVADDARCQIIQLPNSEVFMNSFLMDSFEVKGANDQLHASFRLLDVFLGSEDAFSSSALEKSLVSFPMMPLVTVMLYFEGIIRIPVNSDATRRDIVKEFTGQASQIPIKSPLLMPLGPVSTSYFSPMNLNSRVALSELAMHMGWLRTIDVGTEYSQYELALHLDLDITGHVQCLSDTDNMKLELSAPRTVVFSFIGCCSSLTTVKSRLAKRNKSVVTTGYLPLLLMAGSTTLMEKTNRQYNNENKKHDHIFRIKKFHYIAPTSAFDCGQLSIYYLLINFWRVESQRHSLTANELDVNLYRLTPLKKCTTLTPFLPSVVKIGVVTQLSRILLSAGCDSISSQPNCWCGLFPAPYRFREVSSPSFPSARKRTHALDTFTLFSRLLFSYTDDEKVSVMTRSSLPLPERSSGKATKQAGREGHISTGTSTSDNLFQEKSLESSPASLSHVETLAATSVGDNTRCPRFKVDIRDSESSSGDEDYRSNDNFQDDIQPISTEYASSSPGMESLMFNSTKPSTFLSGELLNSERVDFASRSLHEARSADCDTKRITSLKSSNVSMNMVDDICEKEKNSMQGLIQNYFLLRDDKSRHQSVRKEINIDAAITRKNNSLFNEQQSDEMVLSRRVHRGRELESHADHDVVQTSRESHFEMKSVVDSRSRVETADFEFTVKHPGSSPIIAGEMTLPDSHCAYRNESSMLLLNSDSRPTFPRHTPISDKKAVAQRKCEFSKGCDVAAHATDHVLSGLFVLMSEELFVRHPLCAAVLSQRFHVTAVGRALAYPVDCIVDEVTAVSVISGMECCISVPDQSVVIVDLFGLLERMLSLEDENDNLKEYLRKLTKVVLKFEIIWVLVMKSGSIVGDYLGDAKCTMKMNASYAIFYQALSQFTAAGCTVVTRIVAQQEALSTHIHAVCLEAATVAALKCNMLLSTYVHRPFLLETRHIDDGVMQAHCK